MSINGLTDEEIQTKIVQVGRGNPGCISVFLDMRSLNRLIASAIILHMDRKNIPPSHLWILFKDVHEQDLKATMDDYFNAFIPAEKAGEVITLARHIVNNNEDMDKFFTSEELFT